MKRKLLFAATLVAGLLGGISTASAQENIIKDWDGGSSTAAPNTFGWKSSYTGRKWGILNGSEARVTNTYSGYKLNNGSSYSYSADSELSSKILWIRYNQNQNEYYTYTFGGLKPGHTYRFSGLVGHHNNEKDPKFTISVEGKTTFNSIVKSISTKTTLFYVYFDFTVPANDKSEKFVLKFNCTYTKTDYDDCMEALSALSIVEYCTPVNELLAEAKSVPGTHASLQTAIQNAEEKFADGTVAENKESLVSALEAAIAEAREANKVEAIAKEGTEDDPANWTGAIVNPSFEESESFVIQTNGDYQLVPAGWKASKTWDAAAWMYSGKSNERVKDGRYTYKVRFNWASDTYSISQTITNLPKGKYVLTADVDNYNANNSESKAQISVNDEFATELTKITAKTTLKQEFFLSEAGDIEIKLVSDYTLGTGSSEGVLYWDNIKLLNYGTESLADAELEAAKQKMNEVISIAKVPTANIGDDAFQFSATKVNALKTALATAESLTESTETEAIKDATKALEDAIAGLEINAPTAERYTLQNVSANWKDFVRTTDPNDGWYGVNFSDFNGAYLTFIKGGRSDQGNYAVNIGVVSGIKNSVAKGYKLNDAYAQAFIFTKAEGLNKYYISQTDDDGTERYLTTALKGYSTGGHQQIRTTTTKENAYAFTIVPTLEEGVYNIYVEDAKQNIDFQDAGAYASYYGHTSFAIAEAKKASVSINIEAGKYATAIFPFAPELPEGVAAKTIESIGDDGAITLVDATPVANVPYILYSEEGYIGDALTGFGTAKQDTYTSGSLTGVYTKSAVPATNTYVLQTQDELQAFYKVPEEGTLTAVPYRAYLTYVNPGVKSLNFGTNGEATAIEAVLEVAEGAENAVIYNLAGQRVVNPTKGGIYIVNGQKVLVK